MPETPTLDPVFQNLPETPRKLRFSKSTSPFFMPYIAGADKHIECTHKHHIQDFSLGILEPLETCMISLSPGVVITTMNQEIPLGYGQLILLRQPANITLTTQRQSETWSSVYLNFRDEFPCNAMAWLRQRLGTVTDLSDHPDLPDFLRFTFQLLADVHQPDPLDQERLSLQTYQWFLKLMQLCHLPLQQAAYTGLEELHPSQVLSTRCRTLKEFANQTQYTPSYLSKKLGEIWNESPGKILRETRLQTAADLLRTTELEVQAIAEQIGYRSTSSFIRAFKSRYGLSPGQLRHQQAIGIHTDPK